MNPLPIALVTGGSRGIGAATARVLATRGYAVGLSFRQQKDAAEALVAELRDGGVRAVAVPLNLESESSIVAAFQRLDAELGTLSALVNNAGFLLRQTTVAAMDATRINRIFAANVTGTFVCCREAVHRMSTAHGGGGGSIVNVSSVAARTGSANEYVDYAASKAAIDTLTRGLSVEVAAEGIRVNAVRPGFIYTDMHADGGEPGRVDRLAGSIPMRRGGNSEEVAEAIAWLLSDRASYVTGSFIDVAGGR